MLTASTHSACNGRAVAPLSSTEVTTPSLVTDSTELSPVVQPMYSTCAALFMEVSMGWHATSSGSMYAMTV